MSDVKHVWFFSTVFESLSEGKLYTSHLWHGGRLLKETIIDDRIDIFMLNRFHIYPRHNFLFVCLPCMMLFQSFFPFHSLS